MSICTYTSIITGYLFQVIIMTRSNKEYDNPYLLQ